MATRRPRSDGPPSRGRPCASTARPERTRAESEPGARSCCTRRGERGLQARARGAVDRSASQLEHDVAGRKRASAIRSSCHFGERGEGPRGCARIAEHLLARHAGRGPLRRCRRRRQARVAVRAPARRVRCFGKQSVDGDVERVGQRRPKESCGAKMLRRAGRSATGTIAVPARAAADARAAARRHPVQERARGGRTPQTCAAQELVRRRRAAASDAAACAARSLRVRAADRGRAPPSPSRPAAR